MPEQATIPIRTFTIGFHTSQSNEAHHAAALARHLGTDHTGLYVTPDDILTKVDRQRWVRRRRFAFPCLITPSSSWRRVLPLAPPRSGGVAKWSLRQLLYRRVPRGLIEPANMGFSLPIAEWLRGPLRAWAEDLLFETRLRQEGYFASQPIRQIWGEHLARTRNWPEQLWNVLMFQAWLAWERGSR